MGFLQDDYNLAIAPITSYLFGWFIFPRFYQDSNFQQDIQRTGAKIMAACVRQLA